MVFSLAFVNVSLFRFECVRCGCCLKLPETTIEYIYQNLYVTRILSLLMPATINKNRISLRMYSCHRARTQIPEQKHWTFTIRGCCSCHPKTPKKYLLVFFSNFLSQMDGFDVMAKKYVSGRQGMGSSSSAFFSQNNAFRSGEKVTCYKCCLKYYPEN